MLVLSDDVENNDFPLVNWLLIVANVAVFLCLLGSTVIEQLYITWGVVPSRLLLHHDAQQILTMFSSMFLHGGWLHLIGNMWVLWLFGDNVEDRLGHFTYLLFYLACGVFADVVQVLSDPSSSLPSVGASGAIAGVMAAYITLHPDAKCNTWFGDDSFFFAFRTYKVPAVFIIIGWFVLQIFSAMTMRSDVEGIAFFAHIGGFLCGLSLLFFLRHNEYKAMDGTPGGNNVAVAGLTGLICSILLVLHFFTPKNIEKFPKPEPVQAREAVQASDEHQKKTSPQIVVTPKDEVSSKIHSQQHHHVTHSHHNKESSEKHNGTSSSIHHESAGKAHSHVGESSSKK